MAKKFKAGKCAHCLSFCNSLTSDHVFPKSWYPTTTPHNIEKWQMPSCKRCNKKYGIIENDLLIRFGLCFDPSEFESLGISDKALRALNPLYAKNEKDRVARFKKREKIKREMFNFKSDIGKSTLPGFGKENYPNLSQPIAIGIKSEHITAIGEKIIRGTQYVLWNRIITVDKNIEVLFVHEPHSKQFGKMIEKHGAKYHRGPGIVVGIATPNDEPENAFYEIIIWGRLKMYGSILHKDPDQNFKK
jgi:hypothetical protein